MEVRIKVPFTRCRALPSSLICLQVQVHDSDGGERSSNVVGERDIVYKPEKILALKDIDPEERMNMVKAIVTEISNLCKLGVFSLEVMEDSSNPKLISLKMYRLKY